MNLITLRVLYDVSAIVSLKDLLRKSRTISEVIKQLKRPKRKENLARFEDNCIAQGAWRKKHVYILFQAGEP